MEAAVIRDQYDSVIARHYDDDPQSIIGNSLDRAISQLRDEDLLRDNRAPMRIFDIGMGTGNFLQRLRNQSARPIQPYGLDISSRMVEIAAAKIPDLTAAVDDGANLDQHFRDQVFDVVSTHFVTGFVPLTHLAPRIHARLSDRGYWTFVGGTSAGYTELQQRARQPLVRFLMGGRMPELNGLICPDDETSIIAVMEDSGFEIITAEVYRPELCFEDFDSFMAYAYHGGWLTPFIEQIGLQRAARWQQAILNRIAFPLIDHHRIAVILARRLPAANGA